MEDVAWTFRFPPSELERMTPRQLMRWHRAATRIQRQLG